MRVIWAVLPVVLCWYLPVYSQSTRASLTGRITDPNKAVIIGATVTVVNTGTGIHYQGVTNETGEYYIPDLPQIGRAHV